MRTKPLLLAAALGLASIASSMAQVYSVNAVGFVKVSVPPGFSLIGNPLSNGGNKLSELFPQPPNNTAIYKYVNGSYRIYTYSFGEWDNPDVTLSPGEGAFIKNPGGTPLELVFVGEVMQGNLSLDLPSGFSIRASMVPQQLPLSDPNGGPSLNFPAQNNDVVYFYRNNRYDIYTYSFGEWDRAPIPAIGEGFWVRKVSASQWTRTFSVNPTP